MSDIYLAISETPTVVTLTSAIINSAVASSVTVVNTVTVALDANSLSALENVTVTVGAAITGTVTVSSLPAISGTVTANLGTSSRDEVYQGILSYALNEGGDGSAPLNINVGNLPSLASNTDFVLVGEYIAEGLNNYGVIGVQVSNFPATQPISGTVTVGNTVTIAGTVTANPTGTQTIAGSVTIGAGTAQIGSVTASLAISSTAITSGSFASLTSATLVPGNTARKMATVYNLGAGQLFVNAGASATTIGGGFVVALSSGDYWECPFTTTTLSAIYATAGTASWVSH
jgi:hypothetical protein